MSFSSEVKAEMCRMPLNRPCCALAEAYGILLYCNTFSYREIRIITESRPFANRLQTLFKTAFEVEFDVVPNMVNASGKLSFQIKDQEKIEKVFECYGYDAKNCVAVHTNLAMLEEDCCKAAFLRGAFLAGGSVTDPEKSYHLELVTPHYYVRGETYALMLELGLSPKDATRNGSYIVYFKQSNYIEDFLTFTGASIKAMELMSAKVEKELRNSVNRRVNCDTANLEKAVDAAQTQLDALRKLEAAGKIATLPDKLRETAQLRRQNPEATLSELAAMFDPPVTKSCLNHRLRKLTEMAKEL